MDHVSRFAIHEEANVCTRWRFRIGVLWKHCCLHLLTLKFICFIDSLKHQFNTFKVHGQTQPLTYEGMITVYDLYGESRWLPLFYTARCIPPCFRGLSPKGDFTAKWLYNRLYLALYAR
jgi:hypothetical protein